MARLLEGLRSMKRNYVKVDIEMRKDLYWFEEFSHSWNGVSLMPGKAYDRVIQVDACGSGIGAHDGRRAYGGRITPVADPVANITEFEAANVVIAINTFVGRLDRGSHILVQCDNIASVDVFRSRRGKNKVLLECARHLWMVQAILDVTISYEHIPGTENSIADSLSRLHINDSYKDIAFRYMQDNGITYVEPCLYMFSVLSPLITSRAGICVSPTQSCQEATDGPRTRNDEKPPFRRQDVSCLLPETSNRPI